MSPLVGISNQSFGLAFGPAFGYALGAKNYKRAREAMMLTFLWSTGLCIVFYLVMNFGVEAFCLSMMQNYQPMADDSTFGFRTINAMMPALPCYLMMNDVYQMQQKPFKSILIQLTRTLSVIFCVLIVSYGMQNHKGVYYGYVVGDAIGSIVGIITWIYTYRLLGKVERGEMTAEQAGIRQVTGEMKSPRSGKMMRAPK